MRIGRLFVISGPSGVGKGTVVRRVRELLPDLVYSVSCTTREARPGEVDGRDYRFVSGHEFARLVEEGAFLEWADVYGRRYGTLRSPIAEALVAGDSVLVEVDIQGARSVREAVPEAVLVFLDPPSLGELTRRLTERGTESPEQLARRLAAARREMDERGWFDHVVLNDDVDRAAARVVAIIDATHQGRPVAS